MNSFGPGSFSLFLFLIDTRRCNCNAIRSGSGWYGHKVIEDTSDQTSWHDYFYERKIERLMRWAEPSRLGKLQLRNSLDFGHSGQHGIPRHCIAGWDGIWFLGFSFLSMISCYFFLFAWLHFASPLVSSFLLSCSYLFNFGGLLSYRVVICIALHWCFYYILFALISVSHFSLFLFLKSWVFRVFS